MMENRKENILNAATDIFSQYGFHEPRWKILPRKQK